MRKTTAVLWAFEVRYTDIVSIVIRNIIILVMFPEGTRSKDGKLLEGKSGVTLIARKTGCRIVPCAIDKKPRIFNKTKVIFGEPIKINETKNSQELNDETKRLMGKIAQLLEEINEKHSYC